MNTPHDNTRNSHTCPDFDEQMAAAREVMTRRWRALRELAK